MNTRTCPQLLAAKSQSSRGLGRDAEAEEAASPSLLRLDFMPFSEHCASHPWVSILHYTKGELLQLQFAMVIQVCHFGDACMIQSCI